MWEDLTHKTMPSFSTTNPLYKDWVSVVAFGALMFSVYYFARKPIEGEAALEAVEMDEGKL